MAIYLGEVRRGASGGEETFSSKGLTPANASKPGMSSWQHPLLVWDRNS